MKINQITRNYSHLCEQDIRTMNRGPVGNESGTERYQFVKVWLLETPSENNGLDHNTFTMLLGMINSIKHKHPTLKPSSTGLFGGKYENYSIYWYEDEKGPSLIVAGTDDELNMPNFNGTVFNERFLIKRPDLPTKNPPFADELYLDILNNYKGAIRISSDTSLSQSAFNVWKRLRNTSHKMYSYTFGNPEELTIIPDDSTLQSFYGPGENNDNKIYVLTESNNASSIEFIFEIRKARSLNGNL